jgi:DNA-directed RNA polymerase I, II, and III subunit RPABC2
VVIKRFTKKSSARKSALSKAKGKKGEVKEEEVKKSNRPEDEVVTYAETEYELREVPAQGNKTVIGLPWLTRFERARITGARALQLSLGAPPLIKASESANTSILLAMEEVHEKALPISIRRVLPNGMYQDIPIDWMK